MGLENTIKLDSSVFNNILISDVLLLTKRAGYYGTNNAKGCFDCTDHTPAIIVLMRFSLQQITTTTILLCLQNSIHSIKTRYGVSDPVYGYEKLPLTGIGQGSGLGPSLWCLISTVVIKICRMVGHGMTLVSAILLTVIPFLGFLC